MGFKVGIVFENNYFGMKDYWEREKSERHKVVINQNVDRF